MPRESRERGVPPLSGLSRSFLNFESVSSPGQGGNEMAVPAQRGRAATGRSAREMAKEEKRKTQRRGWRDGRRSRASSRAGSGARGGGERDVVAR